MLPVGLVEEEVVDMVEEPNLLALFTDSYVEQPKEETETAEKKLDLFKTLELGEQVIKNLRGMAFKKPNAQCKILVAKQAGDGPLLTIYRNDYNIAQAAKKAEEWVDPQYKAYRIFGTNSKIVTVYDVWKIMNKKWTTSCGVDNKGAIQGYDKLIECDDFTYGEIFSLFNDASEGVVRKLLRHFGTYHSTLVMDVRKRAKKGESEYTKYGPRRDYEKFFSLASILLTKKGYKMESTDSESEKGIKEQTAYLMGACVAMIDEIHKGYHGDNPPATFYGSESTHAFLGGSAHTAWSQLHRTTSFLFSWVKHELASLPPAERDQKLRGWSALKAYLMYKKNLEIIAQNGGIPARFNDEQKVLFSLGFGSN